MTHAGVVSTSADPDWLSLGPASRMLGVDPATLRRWADGGRVQTFTTPGGHRRFARRSLERLARARLGERPQLATLGATPARLTAVYRRSYDRRDGSGAAALASTSSPDRESYRLRGRELITVLLRFLDAADEEGRAAAELEARTVVTALADQISSARIPQTDAIGLFVAGRRPFLAELGSLARRRSLATEQLASMYEAASDLLDRLLITFVDRHASSAGGARPRIRGRQVVRSS
jgi:hypothetical protein